jgi:hypothetical protein
MTYALLETISSKDKPNICLFLMDAGLLASLKYTRHLQTDNITLLIYKPFFWSFHFIYEIILCETLNYAMTYFSFESFSMYGFIHVPQLN